MTTPVPIPDMHPGDPEWLTVVSASKIAAVVGLSPYESAYSLWHLMAGNTEPQPNSAILERGHYLEPVIAECSRTSAAPTNASPSRNCS